METPSSYTRPDVINLLLIVLLGVTLAIHVAISQSNHSLVASQEAQHVSKISTELKALQAEVQAMKTKPGTASN